MSSMFDQPKSAFEEQLNELFSEKKDDDKSLMLKAISIILFKDPKNKDLASLYQILGLENFARVINYFNGRTVTFFTRADFDDALITALCYQYKEIEGKSWDEIKDLVPFEISSISTGVKIKELSKTMRTALQDIFSQFSNLPESKKEESHGFASAK